MQLLFDMKLFWLKYENVWLKSFKCVSMFKLKIFYENDYTLYFLFRIIVENVWSMKLY